MAKPRTVSSNEILQMPGFLRVAYVDHVDTDLMVAYVSFTPTTLGSKTDKTYPAQLPVSYLSSGGGFIGGKVASGTPVVVSQAQNSGTYFILQFLARDPASFNTTGITKIKIPLLQDDQVVIQATQDGSISLDSELITIGEPTNSLTLDVLRKINMNSFDSIYTSSQAVRLVEGIIKRDTQPAKNFASFLRSDDTSYDDTLKVIGMDPVAAARVDNIGDAVRNPARIEKREVVFEYEDLANVQSDNIELEYYKSNVFPNSNILNRRDSRADTLSLSLVAPNYLMETTKGTVIDIYGNILDLNRNIIPIGKESLSVSDIKSTASLTDKFANVYQQMKREERKSLAYHFELNVRKETSSGPPDVLDRSSFARQRSRFFVDIDKEGQMKINIPASSETGNVPLLTRYENYSTVFPNIASNDPNDLVFNSDNRDVLIESFANSQIVALQDDLKTNSAPIDRFSDQDSPVYIKHGTAYHDISKTCTTFQGTNGKLNYVPPEYVITSNIANGTIKPINDVVSKTIVVSGPNANAGGRSLQFNSDGMIELNVGANTIDKQSLWADFQGGIVFMVGRDKPNNASFLGKFDGHVLMEIGGTTPNGDSRFLDVNNIDGTLDIRVYNKNVHNKNQEMAILRIDNYGITATTPGRIVMVSNGDLLIRSHATLTLDAETLVAQGRTINRDGRDI